MTGNIIRVAGGPLAVVVTVAELVVAAARVVEALQDEDEEEGA
jgi:hypothetical protein